MEEAKNEFEGVVSGDLDTTDTPARYLAFGTRLRAAISPIARYTAYSSDLGESFRPIVSPWLVRATYGVSWAYVLGDTANEGRRAYLHSKDTTASTAAVVGLAVAERAVFQATASMLFPALTIHTIVKQTAKVVKRSAIQNPRVRMWLPTVTGLSIVPALPFMFDEPIEYLTEKGFGWIKEQFVADEETKQVMKAHSDAGKAAAHVEKGKTE